MAVSGLFRFWGSIEGIFEEFVYSSALSSNWMPLNVKSHTIQLITKCVIMKKYGGIRNPYYTFFDWTKLERKFGKVEIECKMRSTFWYIIHWQLKAQNVLRFHTNGPRLLKKKKFNSIWISDEATVYFVCQKWRNSYIFYFDPNWIWSGLICNAHCLLSEKGNWSKKKKKFAKQNFVWKILLFAFDSFNSFFIDTLTC